MSFYVAVTAIAIFSLIALLVFAYFRLFRRLVIEIVDNKLSSSSDLSVSNFVHNAVLFAYRPIVDSKVRSVPNEVVVAEEGIPSLNNVKHDVAPAPGRPFLGILRSQENKFAVNFGVRVIAISRYVYRPLPANKTKRSNLTTDDSDEDLPEVSPYAAVNSDFEDDLTTAALGAFGSGDSRYIIGLVVSEAPSEAQLTYPPQLCDKLRAAGFTQFCVLPPLKTALRLRYPAGRNWRSSFVSRMATAMAGVRFLGSSREVVRQYRLKPHRSPIVVELYDPNAAIFYLPLADNRDAVDGQYLTKRLPAELICPLPAPDPLPESSGLLGSPPLPYKNMNAIMTPWDPYANDDGQSPRKGKTGIERS